MLGTWMLSNNLDPIQLWSNRFISLIINVGIVIFYGLFDFLRPHSFHMRQFIKVLLLWYICSHFWIELKYE